MFGLNQIVSFKLKLCRFVFPTYQKRLAGFQPASSGLSMEMKMRMIERKKKKVEKLARQPLDYIPIVDFFIPYSWKQISRKRKRPELSEEASDERILLGKAWNRHMIIEQKNMEYYVRQSVLEQEKALNELKKENIFLYEEALKCIDVDELQFSCRGPVETLPIVDYFPPLGGFIEKQPPFSTDELIMPDD